MQTKLITLLLLCTALSFQAQVQTPQPSPASKIEQTIGLTEVSVTYSRPAMRGRTIFGDLVPFGKLWRTGANYRTTFSTSTDISIDGKELKKGTYGILSIPNKESWEIIFYTEHKGGGAPEKLDESKVALRATAKVEANTLNMENFLIGFGNLADGKAGTMYFVWENTTAALTISTPSDDMAMKSIEKTMAGSEGKANDYYAAAAYYRKTGRDLNQALKWINKAVELNPDAYWIKGEKKNIEAELNK